ncbi:MAG: DHHW family protein [Acutalibacteraceae bacterium]
MTKIKNILIVLMFSLVCFGGSLWLFLAPDKEISQWERRKLQQMPEITLSSLTDGTFMRDFEKYLTDQFPLRDDFRSLKAKMHFDILRQKDNGGIYVENGYASKIDAVIDNTSVSNFEKKIKDLYESYLKDTDCKAYYTIVPDKNRFLAEKGGYPHFDYGEMYSLIDSKLSFMEKIEIDDLLSIDCYYTTDTHWRQEKILPVAEKIRDAMGMGRLSSFTEKNTGEFYGVYYGQSALPLPAEKLSYLTNDVIENSAAINHETGETTAVYNLEKLMAIDPYDIFLSGAVPIIEIENPDGEKGRQLIIFRDSFGSSLAPLLIEGYSKVTLIDTRYIVPSMVGNFVEFENQDVLFIYSTMMVNNSQGLK